jgi:hypothetical protein
MPKFPRLIPAILAAFLLPAWNGATRADDLFQRLSALRLLQLQANLWNPAEKHGLTLSGSVESRYTTNAALARGGTSDWYLAPAASISGGHKLTDEWTVSAGADVGGYRYLRQPDLGSSYADAWASVARDFQAGPVETNLYLTATQQWNQFENFTNSGSSTEVLLGAKAVWKIRPGQMLAINPAASVTAYSSPWDAGYRSCGAIISYGWEPTSTLEISVYYNGYLTSYFNGQTDYTQYVGAGITWSPCEYLSLSASVTQTWNSSSNADSKYSAFDAGGMLGLQWQL